MKKLLASALVTVLLRFKAGVSIGSFFLSSRTAILEGNVISKK